MFKKGITGNIKYEEKLAYEIISKEISNKTYPNGLWLKAYQKANGDEVKTKLEYIKLRITELNAKANEDVGKNAQEAVVLNRTSTNTIVIAMCAIATMTLAPWVAMYSLIEKNNSLSAKVNPIPFEFENSYTTRQCIISNFPTNLTLDEIENNIQREPENLGPYLQLVNYYLYSKNKDFTKAQEILNQRIKYKSKFYQHDLQTLANLYECGYGVKKDINRAIILYKEAEAYNQIAEIYTASKDITQDYEKAFEYAYKDTSPKLYKTGLARLYYFGIGTEKDLRESFKLQKQTIDGFNGRGISVHADDKLNIGLMYYYGFGTLKNDKKAIKYLKQAIEVEDNAPNSEEIKNRANQIIEKINNAN